MKFRLYLNLPFLIIQRDTEPAVKSDWVLVSERDPQEPVEIIPGLAYFNPLLSGKDGCQVFIATSETLVGYRSGRPPVKRSKTETLQQARGWFMIPRVTVSDPAKDLPPETFYLIEHSPRLSGVIGQRLRSGLGLRVPEGLAFSDKKGWFEWLRTQSMQMSPALKAAFLELYTNQNSLTFSKENREFMLTGIEPEITWQIMIRWVELRQVRIVHQKLFESPEWPLMVPQTVLETGLQATLEYANKHLNPNWACLGSGSTGENQVEEPSTTETISTGALIYYRPAPSYDWGLYSAPKDWDSDFESVTDILSNAIRSNEKQ